MSDDLLHDRPYETSGRLLRASPIRQGERTLAERVADALPWLDELAEAHSTRAAEHAALLREQQAEIERLTGHNRELDLALISVNAAHDRLLTEHIAAVDERNQLRRDLESAQVELADRREHMRRGMKHGMTGGTDER